MAATSSAVGMALIAFYAVADEITTPPKVHAEENLEVGLRRLTLHTAGLNASKEIILVVENDLSSNFSLRARAWSSVTPSRYKGSRF